MIPVFDCNPQDCEAQIISNVKYNQALDYWDGHNWTNGGTGLHKGITRLKKSGKMVIIEGSQWQGSRDIAYVVTDQEARNEIIQSGNTSLFEKWPHLNNFEDEEE
jgi:hypothetical protein